MPEIICNMFDILSNSNDWGIIMPSKPSYKKPTAYPMTAPVKMLIAYFTLSIIEQGE